MDFTVLAPPPSTAPDPAADFQNIASAQQTNPFNLEAEALFQNPMNIDVRFTGSDLYGNLIVYADCYVGGVELPLAKTDYNAAGLYVIAVPAGANSCDILGAALGGTGLVTIQIFSTTDGTPLQTASPTTPTSPTTTTTTSNGGGSVWYAHWNCNGDSNCIASSDTNANTGTFPSTYNTETDCEFDSGIPASDLFIGTNGETEWCDKSPSPGETAPTG
jgi:hypothetical protein